MRSLFSHMDVILRSLCWGGGQWISFHNVNSGLNEPMGTWLRQELLSRISCSHPASCARAIFNRCWILILIDLGHIGVLMSFGNLMTYSSCSLIAWRRFASRKHWPKDSLPTFLNIPEPTACGAPMEPVQAIGSQPWRCCCSQSWQGSQIKVSGLSPAGAPGSRIQNGWRDMFQ